MFDRSSLDKRPQKEKNITYGVILLVAGLFGVMAYTAPRVNNKAHLSLDPSIRQYDTNRDGKIEGNELELLAKDMKKLSQKADYRPK